MKRGERILRKEIVPVDLVSEQKSILGLISIRQLIYLAVGGSLIYNLITSLEAITFINHLPLVIHVGFYVFLCSPIAGVVGWLGFWFRPDHDMFWDKYLLIKFLYKRQNKKDLIYRHGEDFSS